MFGLVGDLVFGDLEGGLELGVCGFRLGGDFSAAVTGAAFVAVDAAASGLKAGACG